MAKVNSNIDKWQDKKARAERLSCQMAIYDEVTRLEEAREEGEFKGKAEMLIKQLTRKFKVIPEKYIEKLNRSPKETIEAIALDIFEIEKIEDLDKYIYKETDKVII